MPILRLRNVARLHGGEISELLLDRTSGRIVEEAPPGEGIIEEDGLGLLACPGFIDLQFNGAFGVDFSRSSLREADAADVVAGLLQFGVTSVSPTLISSSRETYEHALAIFSSIWRRRGIREPFTAAGSLAVSEAAPRILGMHLEGPFLNVGRKGAHKPEHLHAPLPTAAAAAVSSACVCSVVASGSAEHASVSALSLQTTYGPAVAYLEPRLVAHGHSDTQAAIASGSTAPAPVAVGARGSVTDDRGFIRIVTLAPELDGALPLIRHLSCLSSSSGSGAEASRADTSASADGDSTLHRCATCGVASSAAVSSPASPAAVACTSASSDGSGESNEDDDDDNGSFRGVVCSIGHTAASYDIADAAISVGARLVTHLFNAMPPLSHRGDPGPIALLGRAAASCAPCSCAHACACGHGRGSRACAPLSGPPYFSLIADGAHCHPAAAALAFRAAPHRCILVTDAMPALGCPPGRITYGDLNVTVHAGAEAGDGAYPGPHAVLEGTSTLAGAVAPLDRCVRNLVSALGIRPPYARPCRTPDATAGAAAAVAVPGLAAVIASATRNPARLLGLGHVLGSLKPGAAADVVLLHPETLTVEVVYVGGALAWKRAA